MLAEEASTAAEKLKKKAALRRKIQTVGKMNMMLTNLTVQLYLPSMRRLRVVDDAKKEHLVPAYSDAIAYCESISLEERLSKELELKRRKSRY